MSFSVGAVTATLLTVIVSAKTADTSSLTYLLHSSTDVSLKHRRALHGTILQNDTMLNDTVPSDSTHNDTVLDTQNSTLPSDSTDYSSQLSDVSSNTSAATTNHTTTTTNISSTATTTTTMSLPHKPKFVDASKLKQDPGSADGSNVRNKIRGKLGDIPPEDTDNLQSISTIRTPLSLQSITPASTSRSSNTSSILAVLHSQSDSNVSLSASNVSSLSTSAEIAQEILKQLEWLITSDRLSDHLSDDYSTTTNAATTAAAHYDHNVDDNIGTFSSPAASDLSTSPVLPAALALGAVSERSSVYLSSRSSVSSRLTTASTLTPHNTTKHLGLPSEFRTHSSSVHDAQVSLALAAIDSRTISLSQQHAAVTVSAAGCGTLLPSSTAPTGTLLLSSSSATAAADVIAKASHLYCEIVLLTVGLIMLLVSMMIFVMVSSRCVTVIPARPQHYTKASSSPQQQRRLTAAATLVVGALLHLFQSGLEWAYTGLVVEFAASVLGWTRTYSVLLVCVYWLCYTLGRGMCVYFLSVQVRPWLVLFSGALLSCVAGLVMWVGSVEFTADEVVAARDALVWFSSAIFGLSTSVVLPTSHRVIPPSTTSLSVLITTLSAGLGQASAPVVATVLADVYSSPTVIVKLTFASAVAVAGLSVLLKYVIARNRHTTSTTSTNYPVGSGQFQLLEDSDLSVDGVEVASDSMMMAVEEDAEEEEERSQLLNQAETSLIDNNNTPPVSASASLSVSLGYRSPNLVFRHI